MKELLQSVEIIDHNTIVHLKRDIHKIIPYYSAFAEALNFGRQDLLENIAKSVGYTITYIKLQV